MIQILTALPRAVAAAARGLLGRQHDPAGDGSRTASRRKRSLPGAYLARAADFCLPCVTGYAPRESALAHWQRIEKT